MTSVKSIVFTPEKQSQLNQQRERTQSIASRMNISITTCQLQYDDIYYMMELEDEVDQNQLKLENLKQLLSYYQQLVHVYDRKQDVMKDYFTKRIQKVFSNSNVINYLKSLSAKDENILKDLSESLKVSQFQMDSPLKQECHKQNSIQFNQSEEIDQIITEFDSDAKSKNEALQNKFQNLNKNFQDCFDDIKLTPINKNIDQDYIKTQKPNMNTRVKKSILKNIRKNENTKISNFQFHNDEELILNDSRQLIEAYSEHLQNNDQIVENDISRQKQLFKQILIERKLKNESENV